MLQGTGQRESGLVADYADGFITDPELLKQSSHNHTPSDPSSFFKALLAKPWLGQVVIAPHLFPHARMPSLNTSREALFERFSRCVPLSLSECMYEGGLSVRVHVRVRERVRCGSAMTGYMRKAQLSAEWVDWRGG